MTEHLKDSLTQYISSIFEALNIAVDFTIYECKVDTLPEWAKSLDLTHEFLICSDSYFDINRVSRFISKEIRQCDTHSYWFDGDLLESPIIHSATEIECELTTSTKLVENAIGSHVHDVKLLKSSTRLPFWIDKFIFEELGAVYSPDHARFENNLDLSEAELKQYLGTYFPRSYAESFCIFDNIFTNMSGAFSFNSNCINVLSIGCGTGGDVIGLLTAINKHFSLETTVNVRVVEGNQIAIDYFEKIIEQARIHLKRKIDIRTYHVVFNDCKSTCVSGKYDFILSSKMINEIIAINGGINVRSYYDFVKSHLPLLKDNGLMLVLDITSKVVNAPFCPILLNTQINTVLRETEGFRTLIPLPCCKIKDCSSTNCFTQKEFTVTHSRHKNDKSRVAYRVIISESLFDALNLNLSDISFQIQPEMVCGEGSLIADGFKLPKVKVHNLKLSSLSEPLSKEELMLSMAVAEPVKIPNKKVESPKPEETGSDKVFLGYKEAYIIDTNAFIYCPNLISKIDEDIPIFVSAKVVDELDRRKDMTSGNDKKKVQKALKSINLAISSGRVKTEIAAPRLLPIDFDKRSSDNLILSVVLKVQNMGYKPTLVTSDNGFQIKAKTLKIRTIPYTKVKSTKN